MCLNSMIVTAGARALVIAALAFMIAGSCTSIEPTPPTQHPGVNPVDRVALARMATPACALSAEKTDLGNANTVWVGLVTDETYRPLRRLSADLARHEIALADGAGRV